MTIRPTPSQTAGPFFSFALLDGFFGNELVPPDTPGAIRIRGQLLDGVGEPVPDAMVELWNGSFGRSGTDDGWFEFVALKPEPTQTADGRLQAPHLEVCVFSRGLLRQLVTRMYFPDEEAANANDPLLAGLEPGARADLVAREADGGLRFDIRLQGDRQTTFFAL